MRLTVLGCAGSGPGPTSPASSYLITAGDTRLLVDLGNGSFGVLQRHLDPWLLDAVVLSHLHADHCADMDRFADRGPVVWTRRRLDRSGLLAVTSLRLIPALPFSLLNYAAGLSGVRFTPYLLGTVLGTAPGTIALVVLGDAVTGRVSPGLLAVSVVGGLVGTVGAVVAARRPHLERTPSPK